MRKLFPLVCISFLLQQSCKTVRPTTSGKDDGKIEIDFVQVNDVYEIAPVSGGKEGGIARIATLKKQYLQNNPNTLLVIAGDFVSPSVYNSLQYKGQRIRGAQMIDALNAAGMDLAVFGNHEFDISEKELQDRINESKFQWISSNAFHKSKTDTVPFAKNSGSASAPFPEKYIMTVTDKDGTTAKVGFFGLTLPSNPADYVSYKDPLTAAKEAYAQLKDSVDAVVAITHQTIDDDIKLAQELPGLAAILGGHEHSMIFNRTGNVYITKAHANARSAYVVKLRIDKKQHTFTVPKPQLEMLNEKVALDSSTNLVVQKWTRIADSNYQSLGFDPRKVVLATGTPLDGRETEIRTRSTNLTSLITSAIAAACPQADVVLFNSGSIRVDDILTPPITQYDILRSLPFGGSLVEVDMKGSLLLQVLQTGVKNYDNGGFLQYQPLLYNADAHSFSMNNALIDPSKVYRVALNDFLISGKETNLGFLTKDNPGITKVYPAGSDIRLAIIKYLEAKNKQ